MPETAIIVNDLYKKYNLGTINTGTLSEDLKKTWAKLRGKEDPTLKIGEVNTKEYWALNGIDFEIKKGEVVGIIGKNGAGKSTLLKILSRVTIPSKGSIHVNGRIASLLEVGTGFHPDLTGKENIFMNGAILGMNNREIRKNLEEIIEFSGVKNYIDTPVKRYSSGMYVRLAFAVAAHLEPDILIIDEVLAVGDMEFQKKCLGKLEQVGKQGRTILFVSHDMQAISALTTRSILLKKGRIDFDGATAATINHYLESNISKSFVYEDFTEGNLPKLSKVELLTSHSGNVHKNGDPLEINFTIFLPEPVKNMFFSFQVVDNKSRNFIHCWVSENDLSFGTKAGYVTLKCKIPKLRLYKGFYSLHTYLTEPPGGRIFQVLENICPFEVDMFDMQREFGWADGTCAYLEDNKWEIS